MNVDKFGHHIHKRMRFSDFFDLSNKTIIKTPDGDYNLQTSRLKGVLDPIEADEVASKAYVDKISDNYCTKHEAEILIGKCRYQILKVIDMKIADLFTKTSEYIDQSIKDAYAGKLNKSTHNDKTTSS